MKPLKVLLLGLGSIGRRHKNVLLELEPDTEFFALRSANPASSEPNVQNCYTKQEVPQDIDFVIISNPTVAHYESMEYAITLGKPVFLEKPPLASLDGVDLLMKNVKGANIPVYTAFNFRFHDLIRWAKENIDFTQVYEVTAYSGSYLPDWRKNVDYREVYSSKASLGGGVHLDLIHEMDYLIYLLGKPQSSHSITSKLSHLEIDSMDYAHYSLNYPNKQATITLNYYRKDTKRTVEFVMNGATLLLDLINGTVTKDQTEIVYRSKEVVSDTYFHQMRYFLECIKEEKQPMNSLEEAVETLKIALA